MGKYFGTDGVRGIANTELTNEFSYKCGRAVAKYVKKLSNDKKRVLIGMDTRVSSPMISASIEAGLMAEGVDVTSVGIISTPAVSYLTRIEKYDMGIMVSASHNPAQYNGIKLIGSDGYKLSDETELEIEGIIDSLEKEELDGINLGTLKLEEELLQKYEEHIMSLVPSKLKGMKIAIDAGDGVMSKIAPNLLKKLGAEVISIYCDGNGAIINDDSGSTSPEKIANLVKENGFDIGVAFDGDADRAIFSDECGNVIDGDHVIAFNALRYRENNRLTNSGVVTTTMSNGAFEKFLKENEINLIRADVGDKYVMEEMRKNDYVIGGEQSGHIIFLDHNTMGDGLQTAILVFKELYENKFKASKITNLYEDYPQILLNAKASDELKKSWKENKNIKTAIEELEKNNSDFRILIRPSGTEKVIRVMIEGMDKEKIEKEANKLKEIIEREK